MDEQVFSIFTVFSILLTSNSAPIYAMVLEKADAIPGWRELAGPTNSEKAREAAPQRYYNLNYLFRREYQHLNDRSIRALFGTDGTKNAVHGSDSPASAEREIKLVFGEAGAKLFVIEPVAKSLSKVPSKAASVAELTKTVSSPAVNKGSVEVLPKAPSAGTAINKTTSRDSVNKNAVAASTKSLNKAPSASAVNKTKTASGNSLNKNASGSAINKTGSRASIAKNPSGTSLNKGGSADKVAKSPSKPGSKQGSKEKIGPEPIPEAQ